MHLQDMILQYIFVILLFNCTIVYTVPALKNYDIWGDKNETNNIQRSAKVLNFFSLPDQRECSSTDGRRKGICMNTYECRIEGGKSFGACALGFGVCCVFSSTCEAEVKNNITYFVNPDFPSLSTNMKNCAIKIKKIDSNISQIRLDFIHFHIGQPNRRTGVCDDDIFSMQGGNIRDLRLCGLNSGQHIYIDVENIDEPLSVTMKLSNRKIGRLWEVRITQIPLNQRAPNGCLQYHTGRKGIIQTMNFAENGRKLANQDYTICMRQEEGYCSIAYEPCDENSFKIGGNNSTNNATNDNNNNNNEEFGSGEEPVESRMCGDRIIMPCESDDLIMSDGEESLSMMCDLVHCGNSLCPDADEGCRVESSVTPFTIGVLFGPGARDESPDDNIGMCLTYEQLPCTV